LLQLLVVHINPDYLLSFLQSGLQFVEGGEVEEEVPPEVVEEEFELSDIMSEEVDEAIISKEEQLKKVRGGLLLSKNKGGVEGGRGTMCD
jgi:hypothetical protein